MNSIFLREPSPNEKRCIVRHGLGFYTNLVVAGIYSVPRDLASEAQLQQLDYYVPALTECIRQHPFLAAVVQNPTSNNVVFARSRHVDLRNHFRLLRLDGLKSQCTSDDNDEAAILQKAVEQLHNSPEFGFTNVDTRPPWALDVLLLSGNDTLNRSRVLLSFTYSHSHGDGMSGIAFHRTLCEALQRNAQSSESAKDLIVEIPEAILPPQGDTPLRIPISWSYLLRPLLGAFLPSFLTRFLGISGSISGADDGTFTGSKTFTDTRISGVKATTSVEALCVDAQTLKRALAACKKNDAKMTALLSHLIARAMSSALIASDKASEHSATNLVSQTPVNLRKALGVPDETVGNYAGGAYLRYDLVTKAAPLIFEDSWYHIHSQGQQLAQSASTVQDQPVGLLRYVSNFSTWLQGQIGEGRDCSWELSNIGTFDPYKTVTKPSANQNMDVSTTSVQIEEMLFSQPASPIGPPLNFNIASVMDGRLNIYVSWQFGSLGELRGQKDESEEQRDRKFVKHVMKELSEGLDQVGQTS